MVKYRRNFFENPQQFYFITIVTNHRRRLFGSAKRCDKVLESISLALEKSNGMLDSWVLLPDHIHLIVGQGESTPAKIIWQIKRWLSFEFPELKPMWQGRYWEHQIRDDEDYRRHVEYIHFNPTKHDYVKYPVDWNLVGYESEKMPWGKDDWD